MIDYHDKLKMFALLKAVLGDSNMLHYYETAVRRKERPLLGMQLLETYPDRLVYVVANYLTAVMCGARNVQLYDRKGIWVATGDEVLTDRHLEPLINRDVFFMPTARQCSQWLDAMPPLGGAPCNWTVDRSLKDLAGIYPPAIDWDTNTLMTLPGNAWVTFYNRWGGDPIALLRQLNLLPSYLEGLPPD